MQFASKLPWSKRYSLYRHQLRLCLQIWFQAWLAGPQIARGLWVGARHLPLREGNICIWNLIVCFKCLIFNFFRLNNGGRLVCWTKSIGRTLHEDKDPGKRSFWRSSFVSQNGGKIRFVQSAIYIAASKYRKQNTARISLAGLWLRLLKIILSQILHFSRIMSAPFLRYIFLIAKKFPFPAGFILNAGVAIIVSAMVNKVTPFPSNRVVNDSLSSSC